MELEAQLESMNEKIALLEYENSQLKAEMQSNMNQDSVGNPSRQIQILQQKCLNLERLILFGDISTVPHVVHDFKAMTQFYLLQLAKVIYEWNIAI